MVSQGLVVKVIGVVLLVGAGAAVFVVPAEQSAANLELAESSPLRTVPPAIAAEKTFPVRATKDKPMPAAGAERAPLRQDFADAPIAVDRSASRPVPAGRSQAADSSGFETEFLVMAYRQALNEDPALAVEIRRQIDRVSNGQADAVLAATAQQPNAGVETAPADQLAEHSEPPKDEDFSWCQNRPPLQAETFRCPCPSDPGYRPYWREHMDPAIATAAGC